jgi:hypothetical protein
MYANVIISCKFVEAAICLEWWVRELPIFADVL